MRARFGSIAIILISGLVIGLLGNPVTAFMPDGKPVDHAAWNALPGEFVKRSPGGVNRVD